MKKDDINIKILCQNIANNPKDFDASTLEIWFNRFAKQRFNEETTDKVVVNGEHRSDKVALSLLDVVGSVLCECENPSRKRNGCCRNCGGEIK